MPVSSTETTSDAEELQIRDLSKAFGGLTVAESWRLSVALRLAVDLFRVIPATGMPVTETSHWAETPLPSTAEAVMIV